MSLRTSPAWLLNPSRGSDSTTKQNKTKRKKKKKEKLRHRCGLTRVTPLLHVQDAGRVPRSGGTRVVGVVGARLGKKCGGSGGLAENKSQRLGAVTLCPNWFRQTKLHCPLTRTNKPSWERLKFTGDLKYLPWYLIRLITTLLLCSQCQN